MYLPHCIPPLLPLTVHLESLISFLPLFPSSLQPLDLSLPPSYRSVSLEQLIAETEGYHQLIHRQVQDISNSMGSAEVGNKLRDSARSMLAALGQCILIIKDSQLNQPRMMLNTAVENPSSPLELQTTPTVDKDILEVGPRWKEAEEEPATVTTTEGAANEIRYGSLHIGMILGRGY